MKVSNDLTKKQISFKNALNNKVVLKGLETISEHSASFIAATSLVMASGVRPLSIALTPNVKKENKQHAIANSITSGLIKFAMVEAIALPIENAIKKIDKNPSKYLTNKAIDTFKAGADSIAESGTYKFTTQILKQSAGLLTAIPKSLITVALIPPVLKLLFGNKNKKNESENIENSVYNSQNSIFKKDFHSPSFKGLISEQTANGIGKILNNQTIQNAAQKYVPKAPNITRNIAIATDLLLTGTFALRTMQNKEIEKDRKKPLVYNNLISTGISVTAGYSIDKAVQKGTDKFIDKFVKLNQGNPKLPKYIEGINILRPTLIFAAVYYGILPAVSTFIAEKIDNISSKKNDCIN